MSGFIGFYVCWVCVGFGVFVLGWFFWGVRGMIKEIEGLLVHWGEQRIRHGLTAGLGSQMGAIVEWRGMAPRGTPGSRIPAGGGGMDAIAVEVDAAIAQINRTRGQESLAKLARFRYCHGVTVREQMKQVGIAEGADRTYRNWVQRLHLAVMHILIARAGVNTPSHVAAHKARGLRVAKKAQA
jgi:hypothetical protein